MPRLTRRCQKDLGALPPSLKEKAEALINRLDAEPSLGKKLRGPLEGKRSAWLGRSYRVIYTLDDAEGVTVLTVAPRRDAYR